MALVTDSKDTNGRSRRAGQRDGDGGRGAASALRHGLRVLEAFSIDKPALGVTEIAQHVGLHKSTVSRLLVILEQGGYVERDAESGRFRLGLELIALAGPLLADLDIRRAAWPAALELITARTGETSALVVWNGHEAVVVEQVPSPKQVKHTAALGTRYHTYQSASVQIFLAQLPAAAVQQLFEQRLVGGPYDVGPPDGFLGELDRVRARGYAINDGQTSVEEVGIAAPVYDHRGAAVAGVLPSAPRFRVPAGMIEPLGKAVADTAEQISGRLGYRPRA
jgi:IclR family transcriptional regulator, acetate operon repressor